MVVLDASVLIEVDRRRPAATRLVERMESSALPFSVPATALMEFLTGFEPDEQREKSRILQRRARVVPFAVEVAELAARLQTSLLAAGLRRSWSDVQVAATALHLGEPLATMDRDFEDIPGLQFLRP